MNGRLLKIIQGPLVLLRDRTSPRQFLIISSVIVGLLCGTAAVILKYIVHSISVWALGYATDYKEFFLFAILPLIGILLAVLFTRFVLKGNLHGGSAEIVYRIVKKSSFIAPREMYSHLVTSGLTVGFGGSVGLESPMVSTGAAIGSNFGSKFQLSYKDRTILLACGAASGIAASFNAPIAGVLFAVEVLLTDVSASAFIPLIVSAACGALLSKIILSEGVIIAFSLQQPFNYHNVPYYVILGFITGIVSVYYARTFTWIDSRMKAVPNIWLRSIGAGLLLCAMLALFPSLFGEGYTTITSLANQQPWSLTKASVLREFIFTDWHLIFFLTAVLLLKPVAAAVTLGGGGNGGNFAPSLFVGAYLGFIFSRIAAMTGYETIPASNFTLVGMAGILSGVFYSPLTAIFLIAEVTSGYELMIPLMIVSALSIIIVHLFEPLSMEGKRLAAKLNLPLENRDRFVLSKLETTQLIEKDFSELRPGDTLSQVIDAVSMSSRNIFPVVENGKLLGIIHLNNVRKVIFDPAQNKSTPVSELMSAPEAVIDTNENLYQALQKFDDTQQWNLPVTHEGKYVGFLSKSSILSRYRNELLDSA